MEKAVLIIAGGKGERLWPLSRQNKPKQFLSIGEKKTLLENTIDRAKIIAEEKNIFIVTGEAYRELFDIYLPNFNKENIIFEPLGRDTTAAIALGAYYIEKKIPNSILAVLPADPIIKNNELFEKTLEKAFEFANEKKLPVTIGVKPTRPETGYGYIKMKNLIDSNNNINVFFVDEFKEKPNEQKAKEFLELGNYLWNAGIFIFDINTLLDTIKNIQKNIYEKIESTYNAMIQNDDKKAFDIFESIEKISFDFGIMEHIKEIICVKAEFFWDDLGSFLALKRIYEADNNSNVSIGNNFLRNSKNNIVLNNDEDTLIVTNNIENLNIIKSGNVFFVYKSEDDDKIKEILSDIKINKTDYV